MQADAVEIEIQPRASIPVRNGSASGGLTRARSSISMPGGMKRESITQKAIDLSLSASKLSEITGETVTNVSTSGNPAAYKFAICQNLYYWLHHPVFSAFEIFFVIIMLFALDFTYAFLPASVDSVTTGFLTASFAFLCVEYLIQLASVRDFPFSLFFFLDLIGLFSIMIDIPYIAEAIGLGNNYEVSSTSYFGRLGRTATAMGRRMPRLLRVFRLLRFTNMFTFASMQHAVNNRETLSKSITAKEAIMSKIATPASRGSLISKMSLAPELETDALNGFFNSTHSGLQSPDSNSSNKVKNESQIDKIKPPSKIGILLADMISKKIAIVVVATLLFQPSGEVDYRKHALLLIDTSYNVSSVAPVYAAFPDCIYLSVNGTVYLDSIASSLRDIEILTFSTLYSEAKFSNHFYVQIIAIFSMCLTIVIIATLGLGSYLVHLDSDVLVIQPIERLTDVVKTLSRTIYSMSGNAQASDEPLDVDSLSYETDLMESVMAKMADIFTNTVGVSEPEVELLKDLQNQRRDTAKTVVPVITDEEKDALIASFDLGKDIPTDFRVFPELRSMMQLLKTASVLPFFRGFLRGQSASENLHFWESAERFQSVARSDIDAIFKRYISDEAEEQININANVRNEIELKYSNDRDIPISIYTRAQMEICKLMDVNFHASFLSSKECQNYLRDKVIRNRSRNAAGRRPSVSVSGQKSTKRLSDSEIGAISPVSRTNSNSDYSVNIMLSPKSGVASGKSYTDEATSPMVPANLTLSGPLVTAASSTTSPGVYNFKTVPLFVPKLSSTESHRKRSGVSTLEKLEETNESFSPRNSDA